VRYILWRQQLTGGSTVGSYLALPLLQVHNDSSTTDDGKNDSCFAWHCDILLGKLNIILWRIRHIQAEDRTSAACVNVCRYKGESRNITRLDKRTTWQQECIARIARIYHFRRMRWFNIRRIAQAWSGIIDIFLNGLVCVVASTTDGYEQDYCCGRRHV
jgi:hypothetical protein